MTSRSDMRLTGILLLVAVLLPLAALPLRAAEVPDSLVPLVEGRAVAAAELAKQAAFCSARRDTDHYAFSGCIDWHSAVHGAWTLAAYQRATGDARYAKLLAHILAPAKIADERRYLARRPNFEMPYGRAWFLRLAIDAGRLGHTVLAEMAADVADSLRGYLHEGPIDPFSQAYASQSWALLNLHDYYAYIEDLEALAETRKLIVEAFVDRDPRCRYSAESREFMAICTNWVALAARVLDGDAFAAWFEVFVDANGLPNPLEARLDHQFGLNFSRAWGLWDAYAATGEGDVADAYAAHFYRGYLPKSNWAGSYRAVGHWVAQFGMFALQPLFGPEKGR